MLTVDTNYLPTALAQVVHAAWALIASVCGLVVQYVPSESSQQYADVVYVMNGECPNYCVAWTVNYWDGAKGSCVITFFNAAQLAQFNTDGLFDAALHECFNALGLPEIFNTGLNDDAEDEIIWPDTDFAGLSEADCVWLALHRQA